MAGVDLLSIIGSFHKALHKAMKPRANGTMHLDTCRNARVNSQWFPCQDECTEAQALLERWKPRTGQKQAAVRRIR